MGVYKDLKRGRMHVLISLPPMEIYLVAAEQWGPLQCSISCHAQLKLYRPSECSAKIVTWYFVFLKIEQILMLQASLPSVFAAFFLEYFYPCTRKSKAYLILILQRNSKRKQFVSSFTVRFFSQVTKPSYFSSLYFIWTLEVLIWVRYTG